MLMMVMKIAEIVVKLLVVRLIFSKKSLNITRFAVQKVKATNKMTAISSESPIIKLRTIYAMEQIPKQI